MKILSYFKRIKQPIKKTSDAIALKKETKQYILICIGISLVAALLGELLPDITILFSIIIAGGLFGAIYFGIMLIAMNQVTKRLENLTCPRCNNLVDNPNHIKWEEVSRHWRGTKNTGRSDTRLYVTVRFTCSCPHCGNTKVFTETLSSGRIARRRHISMGDVTFTKELVADYINGVIHK